VLRREKRSGYKAGALEAGRRQTAAEFLAMFDADFVPAPDFLQRIMPRFYTEASEPMPQVTHCHAFPRLAAIHRPSPLITTRHRALPLIAAARPGASALGASEHVRLAPHDGPIPMD